MSEPQNKAESSGEKKTIGFSRRNFIDPRFWVGVLAGSYVGLKGLEEAFYKSISLNLESPNMSDESVAVLLKIAENSPNSDNPNFRSMADILTEGNILFERENAKKAFFKKIE